MTKVHAALLAFARGESAATLMEYAMMAALVAAVCVVAVTLFGTVVSAQFTTMSSGF